MSVVLENHQDPNYEPTQSEIVEYGKWLGMELPADNDLLWIARNGLKAPLPEHWKACKSEKGELYYFNFKTGQSLWDHPMDEHFKLLFKKERAKKLEADAEAAKQQPQAQQQQQPATASNSIDSPSKNRMRVKRKKDGTLSSASSLVPGDPVALSKTSTEGELSFNSTTGTAAESQSGTEDDGATSNKSSPVLGSSTRSSGKIHALKTLKVKKEAPPELVLDVVAPTKTVSDPPPITSELKLGGNKAPLGSLQKTPALQPMKVEESAPSITKVTPIGQISSVSSESATSTTTSSNATETPRSSSVGKKRQVSFLSQEAKDAVAQESEAQLAKFKEEEERRVALDKEEFTKNLDMALKKAKNVAKLQHSKELNLYEKESLAKLEEEKAKCSSETKKQLAEHERRERSALLDDSISRLRRDLADGVMTELEQCTGEFLKAVDSKYTSLYSIVKRQSEVVELERSMQQQHEMRLKTLEMQLAAEVQAAQLRHTAKLEELERSHADVMRSHMDDERALVERHKDKMKCLQEAQSAELENAKAQFRSSAEHELELIKNEVITLQQQQLSPLHHVGRGSSGSKLLDTEDDESLRDFAETLAQNEQHHNHASAKPASGGRDAPTVLPLQTEDLRTVVTEVLRDLFKNSPFIAPSPNAPATSSSGHVVPPSITFGRDVTNAGITSPIHKRSEMATNTSSGTAAFMCSPRPGSFHEQKKLLEDERDRLVEAQAFVKKQRENLEERSGQLKVARKHWKADVLAAKGQGISATSRKGQLLHKVQQVLEKQAQGLKLDEALLVDSEQWLQTKEHRLMKLEEQMDEHERSAQGKAGLDISATSVDTALLVTGFFKPSPVAKAVVNPSREERRGADGRRSSLSDQPAPAPSAPSSRSISPLLSKALERIEARLDHVTTMMKHQHHRHSSGSAAAPAEAQMTKTRPRSSSRKSKHVDFAPLRPYSEAWAELAASTQ